MATLGPARGRYRPVGPPTVVDEENSPRQFVAAVDGEQPHLSVKCPTGQ
ncbi:hypothetical protein ACFPYI_00550 [Halomarina salina]|uniref:Uncharacterized protein n=1 Tax=Halomarina salina TaxID=1872699 RepID=A0ABD5RHK9_9EURY|nr:hypothetical protein [Halomarina salina]